MPMVARFKTFIQRLFYPSIDRIQDVTAPILFIRGMKDEIVPSSHTERLFKKAENAKFKQIYECAEGDHNQTWKIGGYEYVNAFRTFFEKCEA